MILLAATSAPLYLPNTRLNKKMNKAGDDGDVKAIEIKTRSMLVFACRDHCVSKF